MQDSERRALLRLPRTENVGPITFRNLVARFGWASAALEELPRLASRGGNGRSRGRNFILPDERDAKHELDALAKLGGRMIACCDADYPRGLAALEAPPPIMACWDIPICCRRR